MYTVATTAILFGAVLGCTLRVSWFLFVAAAAACVVFALGDGWSAVLCAATLQLGYALGLFIRAAFPRFFEVGNLDFLSPPPPAGRISP